MRCVVKNCKNSNADKALGLSFFSFPKNKALLDVWISFCRRGNNFNPETSRICMEHFKADSLVNSFEYNMGFSKKRKLKRDAVPTIYKTTVKNLVLQQERANRIERRDNKKIVSALLQESYKKEKKDDGTAHFHPDDSKTNIEYEIGNTIYAKGEDTKLDFDLLREHETQAEVEISAGLPQDTEPAFVIAAVASLPLVNNIENNFLWNTEDILKDKVKKLEQRVGLLTKENSLLKDELKTLRAKETKETDNLMQRLIKSEFQKEDMEEKLKRIFTAGEFRKLKMGTSKVMWAKEDIDAALIVHNMSPKAYRHLRARNFPFPSTRTLQEVNKDIRDKRALCAKYLDGTENGSRTGHHDTNY